MTKQELSNYRQWLVSEFPYCQICGKNDIDVPHHVGIGVKRNDYEQIVLCLGCHRKVHNSCFKWDIVPNKKEMMLIAEENYEIYQKEKE